MADQPPIQLIHKGDLYKCYPDRVEVYPGKQNILPTVYDWDELDSEVRSRLENVEIGGRKAEIEVEDEDEIDFDL